MAIHIIENENDAVYRYMSKDKILEVTAAKGKIGNLKTFNYVLIHHESNIREDIMPKIDKYDLIEVNSCISLENVIYFTGITEHTNGKIFITLYQYDVDTMQLKDIYAYEDTLSIYPLQKKVKVFILDEDYIIVQNSFLRPNMADNCQGYFDVELFLRNVKVNNIAPITEPNLSLGIDCMIPVSKNTCVIKTGFSVFQDSIYKKIDKTESVSEIIGLINVKQLITDILLKQRNVYIDVIDRVQFDKTIPKLKVRSGHLIYSRITPKEAKEEVVFFNIGTGKTYACVKNRVTGMDKLAKAYILMNEPHVLVSKQDETYLYNIATNAISLRLNKGISLKTIKNKYVILEKEKNSILGYPVYTTEVYEYPGGILVLKEKAAYSDLFVSRDNDIYLFTK